MAARGRARITRIVARLLLATATIVLACLGVETATRWVDGYRIWSARLERQSPAIAPPSDAGKWMDPQQAADDVARLPVAQGVEREWFALNPDPIPVRPADPDLERRYWSARDNQLPSVYEWNREFVRRVVCSGDRTEYTYLASQFQRLTDAFIFDSPDGTPYPAYRFLRNTRYPSGLTTNAYGWRGPAVPLNKPPGRIRVAFVGASTTLGAHGDPFSYPEYVGRWLQRWAEHHPSVSFDVINAGREGVLSNSIAAIVRQELLPLRPDLVVYYEGANQFWPNAFIAAPVERMWRLLRAGPLAERSAVWARLSSAVERPNSGDEPSKPPLAVSWPRDLDENDPPLDDPRLPVQLPKILDDVEAIRQAVSTAGGTLMMSSFVWLASQGLVLDPKRDALIYQELNRRYWPFSYAHMRRLIDFENRTFAKYARARDLPFNDVAASYPADPRLFVDSIHMTPAGVKLQAWIVFQNLVRYLDRQIVSGRLPTHDPGGRDVHPAFQTRRQRLTPLGEITAGCGR